MVWYICTYIPTTKHMMLFAHKKIQRYLAKIFTTNSVSFLPEKDAKASYWKCYSAMGTMIVSSA